MTPLAAVCVGLALVFADLRVPGVDVLPDVLGWVVVVMGLSRLDRVDVRRTRTAAVVSAVLSLAELVHPVETTATAGGSSTATVEPTGLQGLAVLGYTATTILAAMLLSLALRGAARAHGDDAVAHTFHLFTRLQVAVGAVTLGGAVLGQVLAPSTGSRELEGLAALLVVLVVVAVIAVEVAFLVALARARHLPWLQDARSLSP